MENEDFFNSKVVIITGAAGFIGSHLTERFLAAGARVIGVDNYITGNRQNLAGVIGNDRFRLIEQDINDTPAWQQVLDTIERDYGRVDIALHFASPASPPPLRHRRMKGRS